MIDDLFALLSESLADYEEREAQKEMAYAVDKAFSSEGIALIEAGTGTGKSLAYLLPAVLAAVHRGKRTVISTHTINLQEQLIAKDIPFLLKVCHADVEAVLVKGMHNYACLRKGEDAHLDKGTLSADEQDQLEEIEGWLKKTREGSRSDLPFMPARAVWERINVEHDACSRGRCPHYKECFFFNARKGAQDAQILVVNHHLLLADLNHEEEGLLPKYDYLIIDEAHHLEEVATSVWAEEVSRGEIIRQLERLVTEKKTGGKLTTLAHKLTGRRGAESLIKRLTIDLPAKKRRLVTEVNEAFHQFLLFFEAAAGKDKLRLHKSHQEHPLWPAVQEAAEQASHSMGCLAESLNAIDRDVSELGDHLTVDTKAISRRILRLAELLNDFAFGEIDNKAIKWIESAAFNIKLMTAAIDVSTLLKERLFDVIPSVVLTSATLTTGGTFDFIRQRLGLDEHKIYTATYPSPFSFDTQALFAVPTDMPPPNAPNFTGTAAEMIVSAARASGGGAFVLFTSFRMLSDCHALVADRLEEEGYVVLRQGAMGRQKLIERFREEEGAILFGTDSFWEGVDVMGDALRLVIIAKLPFRVPTEPIVQARCEAIEEKGQNPFMSYTVPQAIVKLKQGIGRLIRHRQDRGCILCLDSRLLTKPYGRVFLHSLPECRQVFEPKENVVSQLEYFYSLTNC